MTHPTQTYDILVVGGGLAGMCASIRAAELGLSVRVFEQGTGQHYLCNSRYTGGLFHIGMDDMRSEPDEIVKRLARVTDGEAHVRLASALAKNARRTIAWLRTQGINLIRVGPDGLGQNSLTPPGVRTTGLNWRWRSGDVMLRTLNKRLAECGGTFDQGAAARELILDNSGVQGLVVTRNDEPERFAAPVVILCDGGFQGNRELVRRHISSSPERILMRNAETGRGWGLQMAEVAGAKLVGMGSFYGHVQYRDAMTDGRFWPYPVMDSLCVSALLLNADGQRFCDESLGGVHISNQMARLADPLGCHVIFDEAIWNGPGRDWLLPANPFLERAGGRLISSFNLETLAPEINLAPAQLVSAVEKWNAAVNDRQSFQPPRISPVYKAHPLQTPPFYAIPLCAGMTYTMGGLLTDAAAQVLDNEERPIAGLLAAGACTGGLEGFSRDGYSGGLSKSAVFGMIAGETAATLARTRLLESA